MERTTESGGAVARVERIEDLAGALARLGLGGARPTLVVVGGAGRMDEPELARLEPLFDELAGVAEALGAAVADGGTDAGVMRLLGRARTARGATFPLVGVAPAALVGSETPLAPGHSHFLLVPGDSWGDEAPWLARAATLLAGDRPSLTLLVNGGGVALDDVAANLEEARPVLAVAGTGRAADALAEAVDGRPPDERSRALASTTLVRAADADSVVAEVRAALGADG